MKKQQLLIQLKALSDDKQTLESTVEQRETDIKTLQEESQGIMLQVQSLEQEKQTLTTQVEQKDE